MSQEVMNTLVDMSQEIIKLKDQKRELLEALKKLLPEMRGLAMVSPLMQSYVETCESAISKAEGEKA